MDSSSHVFDDDYANLVCSELAFLSIHSNCPCNPSSASYDLKIPPATYSEAKHRLDFEVWEGTVVKELNTLHSMSVYELTHLPPGHKVIGNRWVFELKIDRESLILKGRLVAKMWTSGRLLHQLRRWRCSGIDSTTGRNDLQPTLKFYL